MSTVIKAGEAAKLLSQTSTVDLADHLREARSVVEAAQQRADEIVAEARQSAIDFEDRASKAGYEAAYRKGYAEGLEAGRQEAFDEAMRSYRAEQAGTVEAMRQAIDSIERIKTDLQVRAERDVLEFAVELSRRLTFEIGSLHREAAIENLRRALEIVGQPTNIRVAVSAQDEASMQTFCQGVLRKAAAAPHVTLEVADDIAPGGCRVVTDTTEVDARLETQTAALLSVLLGDRGHDEA